MSLAGDFAADPGPTAMTATIPIYFGKEPPRPSRPVAFHPIPGEYRRLAPAGPFWPDAALRTGAAGRAVVDCRVKSNGRLSACIISRETTHPMFGESAVRMAELGWMKAEPLPAGAGAPVDAIWRFEIDYPSRTLADAPTRTSRYPLPPGLGPDPDDVAR